MSATTHAAAARVFARLLAGDIRLYNEESVLVGRRRGDLAQRLEEPIERARRKYLERFARMDPEGRILAEELSRQIGGGASGPLE